MMVMMAMMMAMVVVVKVEGDGDDNGYNISSMFLQTPPAIPTLFVVVLSSIIRGSKVIVDYHNYGHTLLALTHGPEHSIVKLARE